MSIKRKLPPMIWACVTGNIVPESDNAFDLGTSTKEIKDGYIDGTLHVDTIDCDVKLDVTGALHYTDIISKTTTYTATINDRIIKGDTSGGAFTITLPAASTATGLILTFIRTGAGANALTIDGSGAETIDGGATDARMDAQYDTETLLCDGTEWFIIAEKIA